MQSKLSQLPWKDFILILWLTSKINNKARSAVIEVCSSLIIKSSVTQHTQKQSLCNTVQWVNKNTKHGLPLSTETVLNRMTVNLSQIMFSSISVIAKHSLVRNLFLDQLPPFFTLSIYYMHYAYNAIKKCHLRDHEKNTSAHSSQIRKQRFIRNW